MRRCCCIALLVLVAGCARQVTLPEPAAAELDRTWQNHRAVIAGLDHWSLTGRVSIRRGREGWNARLSWQQMADAYRLRIMAPMARGTWQIEGDNRSAAMTTPKQERLLANDVESLLHENLGWSLPVSGARYWIAGIPDPDAGYQSLDLDRSGRLVTMEQASWHIQVHEYTTVGEYQLPRRLSMEREDVSLRVAVTQWSLPESR